MTQKGRDAFFSMLVDHKRALFILAAFYSMLLLNYMRLMCGRPERRKSSTELPKVNYPYISDAPGFMGHESDY